MNWEDMYVHLVKLVAEFCCWHVELIIFLKGIFFKGRQSTIIHYTSYNLSSTKLINLISILLKAQLYKLELNY